MKKNCFFLFAIIVAITFSCKKDQKPAVSQIAGTWSLYSFSNSLDMQSPIATSAEYPCMSDLKLIFKSDGTLILPPFSKCYVSPKDTFGNASSISRNNDINGKWSFSGNSVYITMYDSTLNRAESDHLTLSNNNGRLQLKAVDSLDNGAVVWLYVKQ